MNLAKIKEKVEAHLKKEVFIYILDEDTLKTKLVADIKKLATMERDDYIFAIGHTKELDGKNAFDGSTGEQLIRIASIEDILGGDESDTEIECENLTLKSFYDMTEVKAFFETKEKTTVYAYIAPIIKEIGGDDSVNGKTTK